MKKSPYIESKAHKVSKSLFWLAIGITVLFLCTGCVRKSPTDNIVDNHIQLVNDALDYAKNNMGDDPDTMLLVNSLKTCKAGLDSAKQSCKSQISTCEEKIRYWRLASLGLFLALCMSIFIIIKRLFR